MRKQTSWQNMEQWLMEVRWRESGPAPSGGNEKR